MQPSTRSLWESTIVFSSDTRFSFLKYARGTTVTLDRPAKVFLYDPPRADGSYVYQRTGDSTATLALVYDDGRASENYPLTFTQANSGFVGPGAPSPPVTFSLRETSAAQSAPTANVSLRGRVSPGHPLIAGFVVPDSPVNRGQIEVLIRVAGPALTQFNVGETWSDPSFTLHVGTAIAAIREAIYNDWSESEPAFRKIFSYTGAFPFAAKSKDAAAVVRLNPGAYTVVCNAPENDAGGEALIEVYFLP